MSDTVWISIAPGSGTNLRPFTHSFADSEVLLDHARACRGRNDAGEPLDQSCFPEEIFGDRDARESDYRLPDIFFAGSYWAVSKAAADVLRQFNLGGGGLFPVKVLKKDRQTPVGGEWFCINFGNKKSALALAESTSLRDRYIRPREKGWFPKTTTKDGDIAVSKNACSGPDILDRSASGRCILPKRRIGQGPEEGQGRQGILPAQMPGCLSS